MVDIVVGKKAYADWMAARRRGFKKNENTMKPVTFFETAKLREELISRIMHEYSLEDIEIALDTYVESIVKNCERGIDLSVLTDNQLSVMKVYYKSIIEVVK